MDDDLFADQTPLVIAPCPKCGDRKVAADHDEEDCVKAAAFRAFCRGTFDRLEWPPARG